MPLELDDALTGRLAAERTISDVHRVVAELLDPPRQLDAEAADGMDEVWKAMQEMEELGGADTVA